MLITVRSILLLSLTAFVVTAQDCASLLDRVRHFDEQKNFRSSAKTLESALAICPNRQETLLALTRRWLFAQQLPEAKLTLSQLLRENPGHLDGLKLKSDLHYLAGEDREAEAALKQILAIDSKHEEALYTLGRLYYQQARYQAACDQFHQTLKVNPKSYKAYDNLGLCHEGLHDAEKAKEYFLKSIKLVHTDHPNYDWPYANLANLLINLGEYRQAFDLATEAAERNPDSSRNFYLAGKALRELNQMDQSVRWLKRSIELDSNYPEPYYLLGRIYRDQTNHSAAQVQFLKFRELRAKAPRNLR